MGLIEAYGLFRKLRGREKVLSNQWMSLKLALFVALKGGNTMAIPYPQTPGAAETALANELPGKKRPVMVIAIDEHGKYHSFRGSGVDEKDPSSSPPSRVKNGQQLATLIGFGSPDCIYWTIGGELRMFCW